MATATPDKPIAAKDLNSPLVLRYAKAALEAALESAGSKKALPLALERLQADLALLNQLLLDSPELQAYFKNPTFGAADRVAFVEEQLAEGLSPLGGRLIKLLAEQDRLALLNTLPQAIETLWQAKNQIVTAQVASAVPLSPAMQEKLGKALAKTFNYKEVCLNCTEDASLIGGLRVDLGDERIDGSLLAQLEQWRQKLLTT